MEQQLPACELTSAWRLSRCGKAGTARTVVRSTTRHAGTPHRLGLSGERLGQPTDERVVATRDTQAAVADEATCISIGCGTAGTSHEASKAEKASVGDMRGQGEPTHYITTSGSLS